MKHKKLWITLGCVLAVVAILVAAVAIYAANYYRADDDANEAMSDGVTEGNCTVFDGGGHLGLVFYPGGKVEAAAYAPLLSTLADYGITCVLVDMPLKLAVLDAGAWEDAIACAPNVTTWYIGGHSLGGAMASSADPEVFSGLILLAAYPTDVVEMPVLSIRGSEDGVLDMEAYEEGLGYMADLTEVVIEGGNHAQFGSYGAQDGDGTATITPAAQLDRTVTEILYFMTRE